MADIQDSKAQLEVNEKNNTLATSDIESSITGAPTPDYDDLPDPDVGKSDEERAKLVRPCCQP